MDYTNLHYWSQKRKLNPFHRSKIGKLYLNICHRLGFNLNIWQDEEIEIRLPTNYQDTEHGLFDESPEWMIQDVIESIQLKFKSDPKLEYRCRMSGFVTAHWSANYWNQSRTFMYLDGKLFDNNKEYFRHQRINQLID